MSYSNDFLINPIQFLRSYPINNMLAISSDAVRKIEKHSDIVTSVVNNKQGFFDLIDVGRFKESISKLESNANGAMYTPSQVIFTPFNTVFYKEHSGSSNLIGAYWCPYIPEHNNDAFVDIPKVDPQHDFIFTGGMNGCHLVATAHPDSEEMFRLYHVANPDAANFHTILIEDEAHRAYEGLKIISEITYGDYSSDAENREAVQSFSCLFYHNNNWWYGIQPQLHKRYANIENSPIKNPFFRRVMPNETFINIRAKTRPVLNGQVQTETVLVSKNTN